MSIKSPTTYPEHVVKTELDGKKELAKEQAKEIAPFGQMLIDSLHLKEILPESLYGVVNYIGTHQLPASDNIQMLLMGMINRATDLVVDGSVKQGITYADNEIGLTLRIDPAMAAMLRQREKINDEIFDKYAASAGYSETEREYFYRAQQPYPTIPDLILWARYFAPLGEAKRAFDEKFDLTDEDYDVWEWQTLQRLNTVQAQSLLKRGTLSEPDFETEIGRIGWQDKDREFIKELGYILPNSMLFVQGGLVQELDEKTILENISKSDIHPDYAQTYLDAVLTKPASQDIVAWQLRKDPDLSILEQELKKIGIHPKYTDIYKTLAYQIPPVADIITMAVREAFTPSIAAKFGQYEDFPPDLELYAGQKGLSKEWAERYWAAHWALPSPQQGFQMLHRGVIDESELNMLLRAQDVMPFWRDKLTAIAYRPLTRVDVRRMYKQGVLNEREVFESYQDQGYDDENAERMAEFTVRQTLASLSKFTSSDIIKAFSSRMIDRGTALSLLRDIDIRPEDASYIISTAEYKRQWAFTDDQIAGIRNLYKKRIYDENQARDKLARLNLPAEQIEVLMQQWFYDKVAELDATWTTAQTLKFLKRKLITVARAKHELNLNGYNNERINVLLRDTQWTPPTE